jgi:VanZ family protein
MPRSGAQELSDRLRPFLTRPMTLISLTAAMALLGIPIPTELSHSSSLLVSALFNFAHFPLFALVTFIVCRGLRCRTPKDYAVAVLVALFVSVGTEFAQTLTGSREASWSDATTDMLGALSGMGLSALVSTQRPTVALRSVGLSLVVAACVALACMPLIEPLRIHLAQRRAFPELYRGDFPGTELLVEALADLDDVELQPREGALDIKLLKGNYRGVVVWHFMSDWRGFEKLAIDIENLGDEPFPLEVQIRDRQSSLDYADRFNAVRELAPRERAVVEFKLADLEHGPADRLLRLDQISLMTLFRAMPGSNRLSLRSIRLE